jgi:hypothetical protein
LREKERKKERKKDRKTDKQKDRQTERKTDRQKEKQTDRQKENHGSGTNSSKETAVLNKKPFFTDEKCEAAKSFKANLAISACRLTGMARPAALACPTR